MTAIYLWINAVLYAGLAAWCTLAPTATSQAVGFTQLSASGRSEYAVIYGGMQFGFAFLFGWAALGGHLRFGLVFALALYVPIVLFRAVSLWRFWPVGPTTLWTAMLEVLLLGAALALWWSGRAID